MIGLIQTGDYAYMRIHVTSCVSVSLIYVNKEKITDFPALVL